VVNTRRQSEGREDNNLDTGGAGQQPAVVLREIVALDAGGALEVIDSSRGSVAAARWRNSAGVNTVLAIVKHENAVSRRKAELMKHRAVVERDTGVGREDRGVASRGIGAGTREKQGSHKQLRRAQA